MEKTMSETVSEVSEIPQKQNEKNGSNVLEEAKRLRGMGMSYEEVGKELGMSKSKVFRLLKNQPSAKQSNTMTEPDEPDETSRALPMEPPEFLTDVELKEESKRLKDEISLKRLRARARWLDYVAQNPSAYLTMNQNWDGHGNPRQDSEITKLREDFKDLKATIQNQGTGKLVLESIATGFSMAPKSSGRDPMEYLMAGNNLRESVEKNVQSQYSHGVEKSVIDLKLAEMAQLERVENKKIDLTEKRHDEAIEERNQIYGIVKEAIKGPVETLTRSLGSAAADKIRGIPKAPQIVDVTCPSCAKIFKADGNARLLICGHCGAQLQKQGSPPQQPPETPQEPIPQTETPQTEPQPSETPQASQETPSEPKKSDALTDF